MQGITFETVAWAMEYFDFGGRKASDKLQRYLHLKEVQDCIPSLDTLSAAEQLEKVTSLAAQKAGEWIEQLLQEMSGHDIQQAASQPVQTAISTVEMFQAKVSHGLLEWSDSEHAAEHLSTFLGGLGLEPRQLDSHLAAVVFSVHGQASTQAQQQHLHKLSQVCVSSQLAITQVVSYMQCRV